jgi:uncharacterized protein
MSKAITVIVKPTHACNLRCDYCYIEPGAEGGRMDSRILEKMVVQLSTLPGRDKVHYIWHGGEPLLMGLDFYKEAIQIQKVYANGRVIENSMQSNATLINENIVNFCQENGFSIGSSLDGPQLINDRTRHYADGTGAFNDIWRGVQLLRERNKALREEYKRSGSKGKRPEYLGGGVITILTRKNIAQLPEIYNFFKANNMSIKINPLIKSGRAIEHMKDLGIDAIEYGQALVQLFNRWFYEEEEGIDVDPLSMILGNLMTGKPIGCNFSESCRDSFVSVGPQGDIYPCGRFDGVKEYWLGNVTSTTITEALNSEKHKSMSSRRLETVVACAGCKYGKICNSGCMHNAYMQRGQIGDKDFYCSSHQILFSHLEKALDLELAKAVVDSKSIPVTEIAPCSGTCDACVTGGTKNEKSSSI